MQNTCISDEARWKKFFLKWVFSNKQMFQTEYKISFTVECIWIFVMLNFQELMHKNNRVYGEVLLNLHFSKTFSNINSDHSNEKGTVIYTYRYSSD